MERRGPTKKINKGGTIIWDWRVDLSKSEPEEIFISIYVNWVEAHYA